MSSLGNPPDEGAAIQFPARGYDPPLARRVVARAHSLTIWLMALIGMAPAVWSATAVMSEGEDWTEAPAWAVAAVYLSVVQAGMAMYVAQLRDFSSLRMASLAMLLSAIAYAFVAGLIFWEPQEAALLDALEIEPMMRQRGRAWCFVMASLLGLAAYLLGRSSTEWRRDFERAMAADALRRRQAGS